MIDAKKVELLNCSICSKKLLRNPLYDKSISMYCPQHGDFFVQNLRDEEPRIIFRPFEPIVLRSKAEATNRPKIDHVPPSTWNREFFQRSPGQVGRSGIIVRCDETGDIFYSLTQAGETLGLQPTAITKHLKGFQKTVGGYTFTKMGTTDQLYLYPQPRPRQNKSPYNPRQLIQCEQTGFAFASIRKAASAMNLCRDSIVKQLNGKKETVHGYTFKRI